MQVNEVLREEEMLEEDRRRQHAERENKLKSAQALLLSQQQHLQDREEKRRQRMAEIEHERHELMERFALEDRVEQMTAQKRRLKIQDHKREVDKQIQMRRAACDAERQRDLAEKERLKADEETVKCEIEAERRRLILECAGTLAEFLPKGVLKNESELDLINSRLKQGSHRNVPFANVLSQHPNRTRSSSTGASRSLW